MRKMQVAVFVGFIALVVGWLFVHERDPSTRLTETVADAGAADAESDAAADAEGAGGGGGAGGAGDGGGANEAEEDAGAPDAGLQELTDAPKAVRFGVILITYQGAELAAEDARSKDEALKLARELVELARTDFEEAVKKGDKGSMKNAGRMFRGILEPDSEYALFSLEEEAVSEPVDTPRGYWIVKRLKDKKRRGKKGKKKGK